VHVDRRSLELLPEFVSPRSQVVARDIDGDARQPGAQAAIPAKALPAFVRPEQSILRDGLRQVGIPGRARHKPAYSRLVKPDQLVDVIELADDSGPLRYG